MCATWSTFNYYSVSLIEAKSYSLPIYVLYAGWTQNSLVRSPRIASVWPDKQIVLILCDVVRATKVACGERERAKCTYEGVKLQASGGVGGVAACSPPSKAASNCKCPFSAGPECSAGRGTHLDTLPTNDSFEGTSPPVSSSR